MHLNISSTNSLTLVLVGATLVMGVQAQVSKDVDEHHRATRRPLIRTAGIEGRQWQISNYFIKEEQEWPHLALGQKGPPNITFTNGVIEGSPGCGRFTGKYRRSGEQLTVSAEWNDDKEEPCGNEAKEGAGHILKALINVRRIHVEPEYWHSDALLLTDAKGSTQITLLPMRPGADLSELQDSFWHLAQLRGSHADFSGIVIDIGGREITFSTPSYFISFPFQYKLTGLDFHPGSATSDVTQKNRSSRQIATVFESVLHKISSYELSQGSLTFFGEDRRSMMVLSSLRQEGIENRRWCIAKYRGNGAQQTDEGLIDAKRHAEITFLNGGVYGSPGCGAWAGTYKFSGDQLIVQAGVLLAGLCYPESSVQSRLVENAFKGDLRIDRKDDHILLRDKNGRAQVLLVPY